MKYKNIQFFYYSFPRSYADTLKHGKEGSKILTLNLLTWRIWWAPNNSSKWHMGFNSAFKGL